ncbi:MAG: class I SAM-dependent rRNA methyltransferase [Bacteroidales bacterium]|nr:class I SAM-dependent rRNA methyltransferase [Bacteroidales bacterium]
MTRVVLKKGREESLLRFHPWVFSGAIARLEGDDPAEGDVVEVVSASGQALGCGHWQIGSIAVRILCFGASVLPDGFWEMRLGAALAERRALGLAGDEASAGASGAGATDCYRLVHGEGDSLPGLVIDYYGGVCVMQAHSAGMFLARSEIAAALQAVYGPALKAVYDKSSGTAPFKAGLNLCDGYLFGDGSALARDAFVLENGHRFHVNWEEGQKTGFFLDQRENRRLVGLHSAGKLVLNLFCYTGGFSIYALAGGALSVDSVDSSARAMEMTDRNVVLNGFTTAHGGTGEAAVHHSYCCDALDFLHDAPQGAYDLMIVDPPAFAKHRGALHNALRAYQRLNADAISKVAPGGIIFTFSCSQAVDRQAFSLAVFSAAAQTGRNVRILARLSQPADHPVSIYHPEGEYLKGLMLYVE